MFDFDGTLSEIAKTPEEACLKESTKKLLKNLSRKEYVAVVSGRELSDIKNKVGLEGLIYAGNHGFEWEIGGKESSVKVPLIKKKMMEEVKKRFKIIAENYLGILIESKGFSFSIHYRNLDQKKVKVFLRYLKRNNYFMDKRGLLSVVRGKKVLEIRPNVNWNKGKFIKFLLEWMNGKFFPVYVGDDTTDENAFRVLKNGLTIHMGKKHKSSAEYFIKTTEIDRFLSWIVKNLSVDVAKQS